MNPELKRYLPAAYIVGGLFLVILLISWIISPKYSSFTLQKTPFKEANHTTVIDSRLYSYNGTVFYSVKPSDPSDLKVLASGIRLPDIKQLYWAGDRGALVVFDNTQTDGSLLEEALSSKGLFIDDSTADYVWYVNFSTKALSLVSSSPLSSDSVYYSQKDQKFYFTTYGPDGSLELETRVLPPLRSFDTKAQRTETIIEDVGSGIIRYVGACSRGDICLVQDEDSGKQGLWAVEGKTKKLISNTYDQILPTNNPALYVGEKNEPIVKNEESEDLQLQADLFLVNLDSSKTSPLGARVNVGADIFINTSSDGKKTTIIDDSLLARDGASVYIQTAPDIFGSSKSRQTPYRLAGGRLTENIVKSTSNHESDVQLLASSEGNVYLLGPNSYKLSLYSYDEKALLSSIKPCLDKYTKYRKYTAEISQLMVGVVFDSNFQKNIANFSDCVAKTDKQALIGQTYVFVGLSPVDGRFVTN